MPNVPPVSQPPPPNRFTVGYTVGTGTRILGGNAISTMASAPNEGAADSTPFRIVPLGTDQASKAVALPALVQGQQHTVTVTIPLPHLPGYTANQPSVGTGPGPTPKASALTRIADQLIFRASMTVGNPIVGLSVVRFTAMPQARSGAQIFNGPMLPPGQQYSSFQVFCTVTLQAQAATSAGTVTISAEGTVTRQAGGAAT